LVPAPVLGFAQGSLKIVELPLATMGTGALGSADPCMPLRGSSE
jgi:hypothetical protein